MADITELRPASGERLESPLKALGDAASTILKAQEAIKAIGMILEEPISTNYDHKEGEARDRDIHVGLGAALLFTADAMWAEVERLDAIRKGLAGGK